MDTGLIWTMIPLIIVAVPFSCGFYFPKCKDEQTLSKDTYQHKIYQDLIKQYRDDIKKEIEYDLELIEFIKLP